MRSTSATRRQLWLPLCLLTACASDAPVTLQTAGYGIIESERVELWFEGRKLVETTFHVYRE